MQTKFVIIRVMHTSGRNINNFNNNSMGGGDVLFCLCRKKNLLTLQYSADVLALMIIFRVNKTADARWFASCCLELLDVNK